MRLLVPVAGLVAGVLASEAAAGSLTVRSFFAPSLGGERLAFCVESGEHCGKTVADAWCRFNGFDEAVLFQREEVAGGIEATLYPDTGARCAVDTCISFRQIKCRRAD